MPSLEMTHNWTAVPLSSIRKPLSRLRRQLPYKGSRGCYPLLTVRGFFDTLKSGASPDAPLILFAHKIQRTTGKKLDTVYQHILTEIIAAVVTAGSHGGQKAHVHGLTALLLHPLHHV